MWKERENVCERNEVKAAVLIHDCCNRTMQNRSLEAPEFDEEVKKSPIKSLDEIRKKMCDPSETKCRHHAATSIFKRPFEVKQEHGESVTDHTKRFEEARDDSKD